MTCKSQVIPFDLSWKFMEDAPGEASLESYDDSQWKDVVLPHDFIIERDYTGKNGLGPFLRDIKDSISTGNLPGGTGWYRKHFTLSKNNSGLDRLFLEFDGVYMNSTVYVNGREVGFRPYGYSSFEYDITPYVHEGQNVVAVRVDNSDQPNSRWYSGCGIYRHVWLTKTHPIHVKHWGVYVQYSPPEIGGARGGLNKRKLTVSVQIENAV